MEAAGQENLAGKVLIDIANPLDFSRGMPPSLFVADTDSLGEQIQRRFHDTRVVKTLNTMNAYLIVSPKQLGGGDHQLVDRFGRLGDAGVQQVIINTADVHNPGAIELLATEVMPQLAEVGASES